MTLLESSFKSTKKGNKRAGQPKGARLAYDDVPSHESRELQLTLENDSRLYNQLESIRDNLVRKIAAGKYDRSKSPKLFQYLTDAGSKQYKKDHGSAGGAGSHAFDVSARRAAARAMSDEFHDEVIGGEHDHRLKGINAKRAKANGGLSKMAKG